MSIPVEIFTSRAGVFLAVPTDCPLFDAAVLTLSRRARVLSAGLPKQAATARLPAAAVAAFEGMTHVPLAAFTLGGVVRAAIKPLRVQD